MRHTEIVDVDRVRGAECGRLARFALETARECVARSLTLAKRGAADQLDGGRAGQQTMLRPPYFTHATGANPLDQLIAADLARILQLQIEAVDDAGDHIGQDRAQVGRREEVHGHVERRADTVSR